MQHGLSRERGGCGRIAIYRERVGRRSTARFARRFVQHIHIAPLHRIDWLRSELDAERSAVLLVLPAEQLPAAEDATARRASARHAQTNVVLRLQAEARMASP
jgi:hypothetical protein